MVPLSRAESERVRRFLISPDWSTFISCIESEMEYETHKMKLSAADYIFTPEMDLQVREQAKAAGRLKIALDVIEEFASPDKELCTLRIEP